MACRRKLYRDMERYRNTRKLQKQRYRERTGSGKYPKRPWTYWEDKLVLAHEQPDVELSETIERSVQAIHVRRSRLMEREEKCQNT